MDRLNFEQDSLQTIKLFLPNLSDKLLDFYLKKAENAIRKYSVLTEEEFLAKDLVNQTVELAVYYYKNADKAGVKSYSQGNKSVSYRDDNGNIPQEIKTTLPSPGIFLM